MFHSADCGQEELGEAASLQDRVHRAGHCGKGREGFESSSESIGLHAKGRLSEKVDISGAWEDTEQNCK